MAHALKPDFVFRLNGRVHLNRRECQFTQLLAADVCASAVVMLDTPCSEVLWEYWLPTSFASFPFTSPPVRHRVPSHFNWTLQIVTKASQERGTFIFMVRQSKRSLFLDLFGLDLEDEGNNTLWNVLTPRTSRHCATSMKRWISATPPRNLKFYKTKTRSESLPCPSVGAQCRSIRLSPGRRRRTSRLEPVQCGTRSPPW